MYDTFVCRFIDNKQLQLVHYNELQTKSSALSYLWQPHNVTMAATATTARQSTATPLVTELARTTVLSAKLNITWASRVDAKLRRLVKKALKLPTRTTSAFLYTSKAHGGLGLRSAVDTLHTSRASRLVSCLTSRDKTVNDVAWAQLHLTVQKRRRLTEVSAEDITDFLNHPPPPPGETYQRRINHLEPGKKVASTCVQLPGNRRRGCFPLCGGRVLCSQPKTTDEESPEQRMRSTSSRCTPRGPRSRSGFPSSLQRSCQQPLDSQWSLHLLQRFQIRPPREIKPAAN